MLGVGGVGVGCGLVLIGFNLLLNNFILFYVSFWGFGGFAARGFSGSFLLSGVLIRGGSAQDLSGGVRQVIREIFFTGIGGFLIETAFGKDS